MGEGELKKRLNQMIEDERVRYKGQNVIVSSEGKNMVESWLDEAKKEFPKDKETIEHYAGTANSFDEEYYRAHEVEAWFNKWFGESDSKP